MKIKTVKVGPLETNCYILEKNNKCLIIDPGSDIDKIISNIGNKELIGILITHSHFDHIGALDGLLEKYNTKVYKFENLEEKEYEISPFSFKVIFTPGHTSDSVSFYFYKDKKIFVGDFIFRNNIGRCDLPTGDLSVMYESINKIKKYPDVLIFPGHGEFTDLEFEKKNNIYF